MSVAYLSTILSSHFLVGFFPGSRLFLMIFECCADDAMFLLYLSVYDIICNLITAPDIFINSAT
jgi:hypothetical protein